MRNITFSELEASPPAPDALKGLTESQAISLTLRHAWIQSLQLSTRTAAQAMPEMRTRTLLSLLTYAYARGIYASEEIERLCQTDIVSRFLCAGSIPSAQQLIVFRRLARRPLQAALGQVLASASRTFERTISPVTIEAGNPLPPARQTTLLALPAYNPWPAAASTCMSLNAAPRHFDEDELPAASEFVEAAGERIQKAIFADCMNSDC